MKTVDKHLCPGVINDDPVEQFSQNACCDKNFKTCKYHIEPYSPNEKNCCMLPKGIEVCSSCGVPINIEYHDQYCGMRFSCGAVASTGKHQKDDKWIEEIRRRYL